MEQALGPGPTGFLTFEFGYQEWRHSAWYYAESNIIYCYTGCHYTGCRYVEYRGAILLNWQQKTVFFLICRR